MASFAAWRTGETSLTTHDSVWMKSRPFVPPPSEALRLVPLICSIMEIVGQSARLPAAVMAGVLGSMDPQSRSSPRKHPCVPASQPPAAAAFVPGRGHLVFANMAASGNVFTRVERAE